MLQSARILSTGLVKRNSRTCSWITIQRLLCLSSSTISNIVASKDEDIELKMLNKNDLNSNKKKSHDFIDKDISTDTDSRKQEIDNFSILSGNNFQQIIHSLKDLQISFNSEAIKIDDLPQDSRVIIIVNFINNCDYKTLKMLMSKFYVEKMNNLLVEEIISEKLFLEILKNFDLQSSINFLIKLSVGRCRPTPILHILTDNISKSKKEIKPRQLVKILYATALLHFYNDDLFEFLINNLIQTLSKVKNEEDIKVIIKSVGMLRIKNKILLNLISDWIIEHQNNMSPNGISNFLVTLAILGYTTKNFDIIFEKLIIPMATDTDNKKVDWLNTVWALTILDKARPQDYQSILNNTFLTNLFEKQYNYSPYATKLLNINGAALLNLSNYKESLITEKFPICESNLSITKEKQKFSTCIIKALKLLLPADHRYLNINVNTKMGFILDAEFCLDNNLKPYVISHNLNTTTHRIAVLSYVYNDLCYGSKEIGGIIKFYLKLLEQQGYKVLILHNSEKFIKMFVMERAQYIIQELKLLLNK